MNRNARKLLLLGFLSVSSFLPAQEAASDLENKLGLTHTAGDDLEGCETVLTLDEYLGRVLSCNFTIDIAKESYLRTRAGLRGAHAAYDTALTANASYEDKDSSGHTGAWDASLSKEVETGGSLNLSASSSIDKSHGDPSSSTTLLATITQPLLKDLIWNSTHVSIYTGCVDTKAAFYTTLNSIGAEIQIAVNSFWDSARLNDAVRIRKWAEAEYRSLLENLKDYPLTRRVQRSVRSQLIGSLNTAKAARLREDKDLDRSFLNIQEAMGYIDYEEAEGLCTEKLPLINIDLVEKIFDDFRKKSEEWAVNCNYTVLSADLSQDSNAYNLKLSQNQILPNLSFTTNLSAISSKTGGPARSMLRSYNFNSPTYNADASLEFSVPICNNVAQASLESASSNFRDSITNRVKTQRTVAESTLTAVNNFEVGLEEVKIQEKAVKNQRDVYASSKKDLDVKADLRSFTWVTRNLDNLIEAELELLTAYQSLLTETINVRQATSTMFEESSDLNKLVISDLRTIPDLSTNKLEDAETECPVSENPTEDKPATKV
jgi:outer membrane protein TolC